MTKKIFCVFLTVLLCVPFFPARSFAVSAMLSDSVTPPSVSSFNSYEKDGDAVYTADFVEYSENCETVRAMYLAKLTEKYTEEEIAHSDSYWVLYRTVTFCEINAKGNTYLIKKPFRSSKSITLSLKNDILPALIEGGFDIKYNTSGFDFSLRLITASENLPDNAGTVFVLSAPSEETSFSCPPFRCINYKNTDGADLSNVAPSVTFDISAKDITLGIPTKTGYVFAGWKKDNGFYTEILPEKDGYIEVEAQWLPRSYAINYVLATDISYNFGRANNKANPTKYTYGASEKLYDIKSPVGGYVFDGWYDNRAFRGEKITSVENKTGDIILYAKWLSFEDRDARETGTNEEYAASFHFCDVDLDGKIGVEDARLALRASVGLTVLSAEAARRADITGNGETDPEDARLIMRMAMEVAPLYDTLVSYNAIPARKNHR